MTAIVPPDIDRSIELPSLPSMHEISRTADQAIDRLLGRSRAPVWPWIAAGVGLVAVIGIIAAYFAWFRRPTWGTQADSPAITATGTGLTAVETSLASSSEPAEQA